MYGQWRIKLKFLASVLIALFSNLANAAEINVRLQNAPADVTLVFQVYDSANAFGDLRNPLKEFRSATRPDGVYVLDTVPEGEVALVVYADENANGLLDRNFIGIPREPLGLSNNYRPKGPPSFKRAVFTLAENESRTIDIELYKVLGNFGQWGVGIGVIGRSSPYAGSDKSVLQPIPAIVYLGERLQWIGPNIQYGVMGNDKLRVAVTASYRVGAYEEDDSRLLAGLGDRESTVLAGLGLINTLPGGVDVRLRYEHDVLDRIGGGIATVDVSKGFQSGIVRFVPRLSVNWLNKDLGNHDFGVEPSAAIPGRPAYTVGSSMSYEAGFNSFIELSEDWRIFFNIAAEFLPDAVTDSPIVADDMVIKGITSITYAF